MNSKRMIVWFVGIALCAASARAAVTTESLLEEMVDLERLTRLPVPAYVTKQFSSYDRKSKSPTEEWFANGDRGQYLRVEKNGDRDEYVMMDAEGPGAIVRMWSANADGIFRIYIDGATTPVIEADMKALFGGSVEGFPKPLAGERSKGWNLYFPFPYARSCKVTSDRKNLYYLINYRTYEPSTRVKSFTEEDIKQFSQSISEIAHSLGEPKHQTITMAPNPLPAGNQREFEAKGPAAVNEIVLLLQAEDMVEAGRNLILEATFDGEKTIEAPVGDFFASAPTLTPYVSLPLCVSTGASLEKSKNWRVLSSRWHMPFREKATFVIKNLSDKEVLLSNTFSVQSYEWDDRSLLFHAKWRIERDIPVRPPIDWTHLDCKGAGRFVGSSLCIFNPSERWWGEGDEKIYVDGETFPSHFGTGTEDYYGYAWCSPDRFTHAYHNQPHVDGPGNFGYTSNNRWHIIDDIPFTSSFKFDMENLHHHGYKNLPPINVTRAAVSYWYARPGGTDAFKPITPEDVRIDTPRPKPDTQPAG